MSKYIDSKIDGKKYCVSNGQFKRHLVSNNLSFQEYWEKYETGIKEVCPYCDQPKTFYQKNQTYAKTCGSDVCYGKLIRDIKAEFSDEKNQEINDKRTQTNMIRYGSKMATGNDEIKAKVKKTRSAIQEDGRTREDHIQEACRKGKLAKYGDETYNNPEKIKTSKALHTIERKNEINNKREETNIDKYGVPNILMLATSKVNASNAKIKDYILPSGKIIGIQGYEWAALDEILSNFDENEIVISDARNITSCSMPILSYVAENRHTYRYFPDIYIPSENRIIKVKSRWWYDANGRAGYESRLINNNRKRQAALDAGYNFEFWVFDSEESYEVI